MMQRACRENLTYFFSVSGWCLCSDSLCQIFSRWKNLRKWIWGWNNSAMENWRIKERNGYCSVYFLSRTPFYFTAMPTSIRHKSKLYLLLSKRSLCYQSDLTLIFVCINTINSKRHARALNFHLYMYTTNLGEITACNRLLRFSLEVTSESLCFVVAMFLWDESSLAD